MKKKISIVIIFVFLVFCIFAVGVVIGVFKTPSFLMGNNQELTDMDKIKKVIEETRPTDIAIMGEDIPFEVDINYKKINKLSDETLNSDKDYLVVIINDINNSISLSNDEIEYANNLISKNGNLFIYLGDKYSTTWDLKNETLADVKGNLSFAYYSWDGEPKRVIGYWNDEDQSEIDKYPNSLGQSLLYCIEEYLQSGEV